MASLTTLCRGFRQASVFTGRIAWTGTSRAVPMGLTGVSRRHYASDLGPENDNDSPRVVDLARGIVDQNRRALSRGITLMESTRPADQADSRALMRRVLALKRARNPDGISFRVAISGPPGVGKSTFIEALGDHLCNKGLRLSVLAIDPSSMMTGGSILGDLARMTELSRHSSCFVRPSPTSGTLGGVTRRTMEAMSLCEAASYDITLLETVGVGQSEIAAADLVDMFVLLLPPAGGDELQGLKKGVMEVSDLLVVNKADNDLKAAAGRTAADYQHALQLVRPRSPAWKPKVVTCSAVEGTRLHDIWDTMQEFRGIMETSGELKRRRVEQGKLWMWRDIKEELVLRLRHSEGTAELVREMERKLHAGTITPHVASDTVLEAFLDGKSKASE